MSNRLVGLVVKGSSPKATYLVSILAFSVGIFPFRVIPVTYKLALQWLPCQEPGIIGSVFGLVGPVSVYCDCVLSQCGSADVCTCLSRSVPEMH